MTSAFGETGSGDGVADGSRDHRCEFVATDDVPEGVVVETSHWVVASG